jgi:hypothetical protein
MADHFVFSTVGRTPSAQMDADLSTLHAPEAAAEVVDEGCRRVRERCQVDIVRSATCVDKADQRMAIRRTADIGGAVVRRNAIGGRLLLRSWMGPT